MLVELSECAISHDGIKQKEVVMLMFQVNYQREFSSKMLAINADSNDDEV